ncbi:cytochrome c oxidase accessory protein CcoG [Thiothrix subterranea]|uniref:Cytochrome c oxidase accessory protein CcoG n=1 Tax=Thiothrix subterranea TaxID=2735563 RepID=A0AA51QZZ0_9GAMM|nr:cytochrome c oxidase accessory protein CcoG [Thiothrix subterranea]MDQ5770413.1 cytochrome c oxidase accessory protein CcoG [Thiothrix subterranea]WML85119.1 cytochrome c oxidase accessory protein CcoG [Thiothrix subterranea]
MSIEQAIQPKASLQPRSVEGRFRNIKTGILLLGYAVFFLMPWIRWERAVGPDQAILFDIPGRRYYMFDLVMHAQDIFWLTALLFLAAVLLFFVTTLFGRVFCGYFCFQTLWTDAFRWIERWVQGDRVARLRLDKQPWNVEKIRKVGLTHGLWLLLAMWTGLSFALYWGDAFELTAGFFTGTAPSALYGTVIILMTTTYLTAGWAKEYVCLHMCPYSRFQSVMFDQDTMIVSYDMNRGEGTTGRIKPVKELRDQAVRQEKGHGDCVDCGLCVQVCPTGIDIRNGLQIGCIHCALCIDACDGIMDKQGWKRGLIRYTSEHGLEGKKTKILKLRTVGYGIATLFATIYLVWSIASSKQLEVTAVQIRSPLYVTLSDGRIQNSYEVKINNKTMEAARYTLAIEGLPKAEMELQINDLSVKPDSTLRVLAKVRYTMQPGEAGKNHDFQFRLTPLEGKVKEPVIIPSHFMTP